jgi:hypothetical protein
VLDWTLENLSADDVARLRAIYEPLTESVRELIDATIRTEVDAPNSTPPSRITILIFRVAGRPGSGRRRVV